LSYVLLLMSHVYCLYRQHTGEKNFNFSSKIKYVQQAHR